VPTYSNPTGDVVSDAVVRRLAAMPTAAPDFTIFADDAYAVHHLDDARRRARSTWCAPAPRRGTRTGPISSGRPRRSPSPAPGSASWARARRNVAYLTELMGKQMIGPNKIEQYRHVRSSASTPGASLA
jgi:hypothetical protein